MAPTLRPPPALFYPENVVGGEESGEYIEVEDRQWESPLRGGMDVIVKKDEVASVLQDEMTAAGAKNGTEGAANPGVVVRGEEIGIVLIVLILWVGAIILFFNRWGKIRMLEPYQPKFCEHHNPNCPMADVPPLVPQNNYAVSTRTFSKFNLASEMGSGSPHFSKCNYHGIGSGESGGGGGLSPRLAPNRLRQNSVFVTSPNSCVNIFGGGETLKSTSRKTKSAVDLSTLILCGEFMDTVRRNSKNSITNL